MSNRQHTLTLISHVSTLSVADMALIKKPIAASRFMQPSLCGPTVGAAHCCRFVRSHLLPGNCFRRLHHRPTFSSLRLSLCAHPHAHAERLRLTAPVATAAVAASTTSPDFPAVGAVLGKPTMLVGSGREDRSREVHAEGSSILSAATSPPSSEPSSPPCPRSSIHHRVLEHPRDLAPSSATVAARRLPLRVSWPLTARAPDLLLQSFTARPTAVGQPFGGPRPPPELPTTTTVQERCIRAPRSTLTPFPRIWAITAIESLKPKLKVNFSSAALHVFACRFHTLWLKQVVCCLQRTPHHQLPPRKPTYASS
jgi:hypothetical protein